MVLKHLKAKKNSSPLKSLKDFEDDEYLFYIFVENLFYIFAEIVTALLFLAQAFSSCPLSAGRDSP